MKIKTVNQIANILAANSINKKKEKSNFNLLMEITFREAKEHKQKSINAINHELGQEGENFIEEIRKIAYNTVVGKLGIEMANEYFASPSGEDFLNICLFYVSESLRGASKFRAIYNKVSGELDKTIKNLFEIMKSYTRTGGKEIGDEDTTPVSAERLTTVKDIKIAQQFLMELYKKIVENLSEEDREFVNAEIFGKVPVEYVNKKGERITLPLSKVFFDAEAMQQVGGANRNELFNKIDQLLKGTFPEFGNLADHLNDNEKQFWAGAPKEIPKPRQPTPRQSQFGNVVLPPPPPRRQTRQTFEPEKLKADSSVSSFAKDESDSTRNLKK